MTFITRLLTAGVLAISLASAAIAAPIDTGEGAGDGLGPFGPSVGLSMGQSFTPDATQTQLTGFSLYIHSHREDSSGSLDIRGYLASWDGSSATAILYQSDTLTVSGTQELAFTTSLSLTAGQSYIAFLSFAGLSNPGSANFYLGWTGFNVLDGTFVYQLVSDPFDTLTTTPWYTGFNGPTDLRFKASFADPVSVPAPAALPVFALGLVGLGLARRRPRG